MHATDVQSAELVSDSWANQSDPYSNSDSGRALDTSRRSRGLQGVILTAGTLVVADLLAVLVSFTMGWYGATALSPVATLDGPTLAAGLLVAVCVVNVAVGLYPGIGLSSIAEVRQASMAMAFIGPVFLTVSVLQNRVTLAVPLAIVATCCLLLVGLPIARAAIRAVFSQYAWWGQPALIVGGSVPATRIYSFLSRNPRLGFRPLGVIGDFQTMDPRSTPPYLLGPLSRASSLMRELGNPWLIVAMPDRPHEGLQRSMRSLGIGRAGRTVISYLDGSASLWHRANSCLDWPGSREPARHTPLRRAIKRAIDVSLTIVSLPLLLPLVAVIAALIKLGSPGPAIYRQQRVGRNGKRFMVCKFRTMVCDGERVLSDYLATHPTVREEWNRNHKLQYDPRVTPIGRWLRKTSLDELPQLWNVLRGEMSLVGPRPILESEIVDFNGSFEAFCSVLPGITGLWQVSGRNQTTYAEHVELDSHYARNWSLWLDVYILVLTIKVVLFRHGAY
jgi:Undecaprenyl-phosphate galactose phosphotransferase WbaP